MKTHHIHPQKDKGFLEEARRDPITGEVLKAGDEVVFCASCKSAFLVETWEYLNKKHCGQSLTLRDFPVQKELILQVPERVFYKSVDFSPQLARKEKNRSWELAAAFFWIVIMLINIVEIFTDIPSWNNFFWVIAGSLHSVMVVDSLRGKNSFAFVPDVFELSDRKIRFRRNYFGQYEYALHDIDAIYYYVPEYLSAFSRPKLTMKLQSGEEKTVRLPYGKDSRKACLEALVELSADVPISMTLKNKKDHTFALQKDNNTSSKNLLIT